MLAQSPEPEAHDKVLDNNPGRIGIWKCWGDNRSTGSGEKPLGTRTRTNNKLSPHRDMTPRPGIEPGPHWWEASALTTAPSLLHLWVHNKARQRTVPYFS